ncbi:hypothetical protein PCANC_13561 [Puccinia coronata f. sp. avenae]|uniref:Uncharacterized protein n=1 Tax=Puccinia coronata f. sp. avenae TaxID=200324 RepID=A0A2N5UCR1_9BASI|nr:hypothetical protein PCASD_23059 [Puccinia coronata f. sp. avenae]PLW35510.1 hypothetical protein PCANC_13561 [Puccinia coronata f. sp. avenae]
MNFGGPRSFFCLQRSCYTTGQVPGNRPRHSDAFPGGSVRVMVPKRLNDALVQLQSRSSLADALKSKRQIDAQLSSCVLLTPLVLEPNASKGHLDLGGTSDQPNGSLVPLCAFRST